MTDYGRLKMGVKYLNGILRHEGSTVAHKTDLSGKGVQIVLEHVVGELYVSGYRIKRGRVSSRSRS